MRSPLILIPLLIGCSAPTLGAGASEPVRIPLWESYCSSTRALLGLKEPKARRGGRRSYGARFRFPKPPPQNLREWLEDEGILPGRPPRWRSDPDAGTVTLPGGTTVELKKGQPAPPEPPPSAGYRWAEERLDADLENLPPAPRRRVGP